MPFTDDRTALQRTLRWIAKILTTLVRHMPSGGKYEPLTLQLGEALPEIEQSLIAEDARLARMTPGSPDWQRLEDRGLTGVQLRWKLTLLDKLFDWATDNAALTRRVLRWINNFLESFGLDKVKEFKEGIELVVDHQRKPRWLPRIFPPEGPPRPKRD
jgi:hypothetical protein